MFVALVVIFSYLVMLMRKIPPSFLNHPTLSFEKTQALEKPISNATAKSSNFFHQLIVKVLCVVRQASMPGEWGAVGVWKRFYTLVEAAHCSGSLSSLLLGWSQEKSKPIC